MKILFFLRHPGATRNFESTLRLLAEHGHQIELVFDRDERANIAGSVEKLCAEYQSVTQVRAPSRKLDGWAILARKLRYTVDYLRYLEPRYHAAHKLRARAARRVPRLVRRITRWRLMRTPLGIAMLSRTLRMIEEALPINPALSAFIAERRPDVVFVSPLVELGSPQADYVRAARALNIRTGLCVYSWDNLTNKGLVRGDPDLVTVWNMAQKREAVELHRIRPSRVVVTGAAPYDQWFGAAPSMTREQFCQRVGLRADRSFVLYMCSSPFIAHQETGFVLKWIQHLRSCDDERVRELGVLIRPHPQNASQWKEFDLAGLDNVVIWPRGGGDPSDAESKADYHNSVYHCAVVMGINTSALIESAIVGRPVHTLLAPEFRDTQEGTLHFHHLTRENGGLLHVSTTFEEHTRKLSASLAAEGRKDEQSTRFVESFVRPFGLGEPATPRSVAAIEGLAGVQPEEYGAWRQLSAQALRLMLRPVAARLDQRRTKGDPASKVVPASKGTPASKRGPAAKSGNGKIPRECRKSLPRLQIADALDRPERSPDQVAVSKMRPVGQHTVVRRSSPRMAGERVVRVLRGGYRVAQVLAYHGREERVEIPQLIRRLERTQKTSREIVQEAEHTVAELLTGSNEPVIVGPWLGEVGFELLYWIPFLNWVQSKWPELDERLVVVSRGGAQPWYRHLTARYIDVFDYFSPEEVAQHRRGTEKQLHESELDERIIKQVRESIGSPEARVLLPAIMYRAFIALAKQGAVPYFRAMSAFQPMDRLELDELAGILPDDYVAVRFYFNNSFPETSENCAFIQSMLARLVKRTNVVLLNTGIRLDDHSDFEEAGVHRVIRIDHLMTPSNNLRLQTIAISRAQAFIGTYGGLSYLAPYFGVSSMSFYADASKFHHHHLGFAEMSFSGENFGDYLVMDTRHANLLQLIAGNEQDEPWNVALHRFS